MTRPFIHSIQITESGLLVIQSTNSIKPMAKEKLLETLAEEQKILTFGSKENMG